MRKNTRLSILRYFEVLWSVAKLRVLANPDTYIITFRGYEILPFMRLYYVLASSWFMTSWRTLLPGRLGSITKCHQLEY